MGAFSLLCSELLLSYQYKAFSWFFDHNETTCQFLTIVFPYDEMLQNERKPIEQLHVELMRFYIPNARKVHPGTQGQYGPSTEEVNWTIGTPQLNLGNEERGDRDIHHHANPEVP